MSSSNGVSLSTSFQSVFFGAVLLRRGRECDLSIPYLIDAVVRVDLSHRSDFMLILFRVVASVTEGFICGLPQRQRVMRWWVSYTFPSADSMVILPRPDWAAHSHLRIFYQSVGWFKFS